jgi:hypothetical protein
VVAAGAVEDGAVVVGVVVTGAEVVGAVVTSAEAEVGVEVFEQPDMARITNNNKPIKLMAIKLFFLKIDIIDILFSIFYPGANSCAEIRVRGSVSERLVNKKSAASFRSAFYE